jgi:predicted RNA binding protein YcfA (HicA-like mRNA interferase family)
MKRQKLLARILTNPRNVRFADFVSLVQAFGFELDRVSGSHHVFKHSGIPELINIQDVGGEAKPYQIRQFLKLVERHDLRMESDE